MKIEYDPDRDLLYIYFAELEKRWLRLSRSLPVYMLILTVTVNSWVSRL